MRDAPLFNGDHVRHRCQAIPNASGGRETESKVQGRGSARRRFGYVMASVIPKLWQRESRTAVPVAVVVKGSWSRNSYPVDFRSLLHPACEWCAACPLLAV